MQCQQQVVMVALTGVLVGVLLGAGASQYAQLISYTSPDHAKTLENPRSNAQGIVRDRSALGVFVSPFRAENAAEALHGAAPTRAVPERCKNATGDRFLRCIRANRIGSISRLRYSAN